MMAHEEIRHAYQTLGRGATAYFRGETCRTDWFIRQYYVPNGFFTPPFETAPSLRRYLESLFQSIALNTVKSMACFRCTKGG